MILRSERAVAVLAGLAMLPTVRVEGFPPAVAAGVGLAAAWRALLGGDGAALLGPRLRVVLRTFAALGTFVLLAVLTYGRLPPLAGMLVLLAVVEMLALLEDQTPFVAFLVLLAASAQVTGAAFVCEDPLGLLLTLAALAALLVAAMVFERRLAAERGAPSGAVARVRLGDAWSLPAGVVLTHAAALFAGGLLVGGLLWLALPRAWPFPSFGDGRAGADGTVEAAEAPEGIQRLAGPNEHSLGIQLGDVGRIKLDMRPVLEVRLPGNRTPFLRENTYDRYRSGNWTATPVPPARPAQRLVARPDGDGWIPMGRRDDEARGYDVQVRLLVGPMRRLYLERDPVRLRVRRGSRTRDIALNWHDNDQFDAEVDLDAGDVVQTRVVPPVSDPLALERARSDASVAPRASFLELPAPARPLAAVAREVVGDERNPWRRARLLMLWLRSDVFTYTLEMPAVDSNHPTVDFVLEARRGHCEYFASALALMLRGLGHPARVARGFRGGDFLQERGTWVLRGSHYHLWTEMYLEGLGWIALDPTPPDDEAVDAVTRTREAGEAQQVGSRGNWLARLLGIDEAELERIQQSIDEALERYVLGPLGVLFGPRGAYLGFFAILFFLLGLDRRRRRAAWRKESGARGGGAPLAPYHAALRALGLSGFWRRRSQTPREYLAGVAPWVPEVADDLRWLTGAHERERYGRLAPDAAGREEAQARAARVAQVARRRRRKR